MATSVRIVISLVAVLALGGCATAVQLIPSGGSRSDAVVKLSAQLGAYQTPVVDWEDAQKSATSRCAAWGYSRAEAFGALEQQCVNSNKDGCISYIYTAVYQCSGGSAQDSR
jgi:hypothetical protein